MSGPYILPEAEHLLGEEVDFDLKLRGQIVDRRETLEDRQRFLRRLLMEEKKAKTERKGKHLFKDEIDLIREKVEAISASLSKRLDRVLVSRLRHYLIRAHSAVVQDEAEKQDKREICQQIEEILKSFELKVYMGSEEPLKEDRKDQKISKTKVGEERGTKSAEEEKSGNRKEGNNEEKSESEIDEKAAEKQRELEEEWKEFILWKQDKIFNDAKKKSENDKAKMLEADKERQRKQNVDERPPESTKSRKSRSDYRQEDEDSKSETEESSDGRSPERNKSRKSRNEKERKKDSHRVDRRPPKSEKSRKSHRELERTEKYDRRPPESSPPSEVVKRRGVKFVELVERNSPDSRLKLSIRPPFRYNPPGGQLSRARFPYVTNYRTLNRTRTEN
ncbi:splicing regulatory glutamine/lysine-rich protein 1-like [Armigeres subalbatus]|uniref:splicing regulatory glutamine/lysine-rich protein 1-like n=1 Tax=Armigeres subalbatus TaxID=124917 RepID=UPI002ED3473E